MLVAEVSYVAESFATLDYDRIGCLVHDEAVVGNDEVDVEKIRNEMMA